MKIRLGYKDKDFTRAQYYRVKQRDGTVKDGTIHLCLCAPTQAGKFRDCLAALLMDMDLESSCPVVDPKGQASSVLGPALARMGKKVVFLNPFQILPGVLTPESEPFRGVAENCVFDAQFNPMAGLDPDADSFGADCDSLAEALVVHEGVGEPHWSDSAKELISGVIMELATNGGDDEKNLATMRRLIAGPDELLADFARGAVQRAEALFSDADANSTRKANAGYIAERLARFSYVDPKNPAELAGIISTAKTQTRFISNHAIARNLSGSSFRFLDLRHEPTVVFLILPTRYIATCAKWFRVVVAAALDELLREPEGDELPVLMVLDEFANLGRMVSVEKAMALAAGYRLQLFPVIQDLTQLKEHYKESWETFLANAVKIFYAPHDFTSQDYVSKLCGITERLAKTVSTNEVDTQRMMQGFAGVGTSIGIKEGPLYHPHEVGKIGPDRFLLFMEDYPVFEGWRRPYWEAPEFKGKYSPDPYHRQGKKAAV